ncbi:MAG: DUF4282 domain-containing protein [Deltaproteobacteria bacterium]|nr:DUF4282 domain-containing protein [Candidatus Deferrimicrobiaceae bacterium]
MEDNGKGLIESVFDISFKTLVTPRVIKILYALSIVAAGFLSIVLVIDGFSESTGKGFLSLFFVAPLVFLILVISSRIVYELAIVVFRISDHTAEIARNTARFSGREDGHRAGPSEG